MKNVMTGGLIGCMVLLSMALPANANLILNSDMESNTDGVVDNWTLSIWDPTNYPCTGEYATDASYSPTHSLKLSASVSGNGKWSQWVNVTGGETYTLSGYIKRTNSSGAILYKIYDANDNLLVNTGIADSYGAHDWMLLSTSIVIPDNGVKIEIALTLYHGTGTIWADNITFVPEPATMMLLGLGSVSVLISRRRRI